MITQYGYSKDKSIMPEGIAVTFGKTMIEEKGGLFVFVKWFQDVMSTEEGIFYARCKNRPTFDNISDVYVIVDNQLYGKCCYGGHFKSVDGVCVVPFSGESVHYPFPVVALGYPFIRCPFKRVLRGFQGFRYTTKLF